MFNAIAGGIIADLLKKLDWEGVLSKITPLIPNNQGKVIADKGLSLAKSGGTPDDIMDMCESMIPGSREKIKSVPMLSQLWEGMRGKNKDEIVTYGNNAAKNLNIFKNV